MIKIVNFKIFNSDVNSNIHWRKIRFKEIMKNELIYFKEGVFQNADISEIDLRYSKFDKVCIKSSKVNKADMSNSDLTRADIKDCEMRNINLSYSLLDEAKLEGCDMSYSNLRGINLRGAKIKNCILTDADLRYADLTNCDLSGTDISSADFRYAKFKDTVLGKIDGREVIVQDIFISYPVGEERQQVIVFKSSLGNIIKCDFFYGREKEFRNYLNISNKTKSDYENVIKFANRSLNVRK